MVPQTGASAAARPLGSVGGSASSTTQIIWAPASQSNRTAARRWRPHSIVEAVPSSFASLVAPVTLAATSARSSRRVRSRRIASKTTAPLRELAKSGFAGECVAAGFPATGIPPDQSIATPRASASQSEPNSATATSARKPTVSSRRRLLNLVGCPRTA